MAKNPMVAKAIEEILGASRGALRKKKPVELELEAENPAEDVGETEDANGVEVPENEGDLTPEEMEMLRKHREMMGA